MYSEQQEMQQQARQPSHTSNANQKGDVRALSESEQAAVRGRQSGTLAGGTCRLIRLLLISAHPDDFTDERLVLWRDVVPELHLMCANLNVELQIIDPFISNASPLAACGHDLTLLQHELARCVQQSSGLFALCFVGDRYGLPALPTAVRSDHFATIRQAAFETNTKDVSLLEQWYRPDGQCTPKAHVLQRKVAGRFLNEKTMLRLMNVLVTGAHAAMNDEAFNKMHAHQFERVLQSPLDALLQSCLGQASCARRMMAVMRKFEGMTEKIGAFGDTDVPDCVRPVERLAKLKNQLTATLDKTSVQVLPAGWPLGTSTQAAWRKSTEHQRYLSTFAQLVHSKIRTLIEADMAGQYVRNPTGTRLEGVNLLNVNCYVESAIREAAVHTNVLHSKRPKLFTSNTNQMKTVMSALKTVEKRPVVIQVDGKDCAGKTAFLAEVASKLESVFNVRSTGRQLLVIARLVQLTAKSSFAHELWQSICMQLVVALNLSYETLHPYVHSLKTGDLQRFLGFCLEKAADKGYVTVILVDDMHLLKYAKTVVTPVVKVDQLPKFSALIVASNDAAAKTSSSSSSSTQQGTSNGSSAAWLQVPRKPTQQNILSKAKNNDNGVVAIALAELTEQDQLAIMKASLQQKSSSPGGAVVPINLNVDESTSEYLQMFKDGGLKIPFIAELHADDLHDGLAQRGCEQAVSLKKSVADRKPSTDKQQSGRKNSKSASSTSLLRQGEQQLSLLEHYIERRLCTAELLYGHAVVQAVCRYITAAQYHAISEGELLSVLSMAEPEQLEVAIQAQPVEQPAAALMAFPTLLWAAIRNTLGSLLDETACDERVLISWSHSVVANVASYRYLPAAIDIKQSHDMLCALFTNAWSSDDGDEHHPDSAAAEERLVSSALLRSPPPQTNNKISVRSVTPPDSFDSGDIDIKSSVVPQPLFVDHGQNIRRLRCLWYQLLHSGDIESLKRNSLCNFTYLYELVHSELDVINMISMFEDTLAQLLEFDIYCFYTRVLKPSLRALLIDRDQITSEVIGRLRYTFGSNSPVLNGMIEQAMYCVDNWAVSSLLVPLTCWISPVVLPLILTLQLPQCPPNKTLLIQPTVNHQHVLVAGQGEEHRILMFHLPSQTMVKSFSGHTGAVTCLALAHSGQVFVSGSADKSLRCWDLIQGSCVRHLSGVHSAKVTCCVITHDDQHVISGSADHTARMTAIYGGDTLRVFPNHTGAVSSLVLTSESQWLITGCGDFMVTVWNVETGEETARFGGLMAPVTCMTITDNDSFVIVSCEDETIRIFSLVSGTELLELQGHEGKANCVVTGQDACQLYCGCDNGKIFIFDLHTGELLNTLQCDSTATVSSLKVTSDGHFLVSGSGDTIHVWATILRPVDQPQPTVLSDSEFSRGSSQNTNVRQSVSKSAGSGGRPNAKHITTITMARDNRTCACGTHEGAVALWDLEMCNCMWSVVDESNQAITVVQFSPSTTRLLSGSVAGVVCIWNSANGQLLVQHTAHSSAITGIQVCHDNNRVFSVDAANALHSWTATGGGDHHERHSDDHDRPHMSFTTKDVCAPIQLLATETELLAINAKDKKELRLWTLHDENLSVRTKLSHSDEITCVAVTSNAKALVTGSVDQSLKVWNLERAKLTQVLVGHEERIRLCAVSDDERVVVSAASDNSVLIWQTDIGTITHNVSHHNNNRVTALAVSADASVAFTADATGVLCSWYVPHGSLLSVFHAYLPIIDMLVSVDANRLVLRLESCAQLPVLCLHNTPASLPVSNARHRRPQHKDSIHSKSSSTTEGLSMLIKGVPTYHNQHRHLTAAQSHTEL